jgi:hypothetical protein
MGDNITPYWVSLLKGYTFATGAYEKLCDKEKRQGLTSRADLYPNTEAGSPEGFTYASFNRHMLLCPNSFKNEAGKGPHSQPTVEGLVANANYPSKGDARPMDRFGTLSCTLYHELFHIVDSAGTDSDNGRKYIGAFFFSFPLLYSSLLSPADLTIQFTIRLRLCSQERSRMIGWR